VPGHELSGVVVELGFGTTGLSVGQRVFGPSDWTRNGSPERRTPGKTIIRILKED
jgi:D-arabinose 1-dehydrogenase-like Zn-dependent alcohol dehydrogenase